jgi:hypothetical protein
MKQFLCHRRIYLGHVARVLSPGNPPKLIERIDLTVPGDLSAWSSDDVALLIEEGRRASDAGAAELGEIRARAQLAFTTCLVLFGVLAAQLSQVRHHDHAWTWLMFALSAVFAAAALAGALAIFVIQVTVPIMHPGLITDYPAASTTKYQDVDKQLGHDYALNARDWNVVTGTERTVLREAILYLTLAGLADGVVWALLH